MTKMDHPFGITGIQCLTVSINLHLTYLQLSIYLLLSSYFLPYFCSDNHDYCMMLGATVPPSSAASPALSDKRGSNASMGISPNILRMSRIDIWMSTTVSVYS